MTLTALLVFAGALAVNAGMPGPGIAALVARVLTNGVRDVVPFLAALWVGEVLWMTVAVVGLAAVAQTLGHLLWVLRCAGAAYLLYLAWKMWRARAETATDAVPARRSSLRMFGAGLLLTLGNPKVVVFYVALLPALVNLDRITVGDWAALAATLLVVLPAVDLSWSFLASRARRLLRSRRAVRIGNRTSACAMAGAAAVIVAQ